MATARTSPCETCPYGETGARIPPDLPAAVTARLAVVGIAPGAQEVRERRYFIGPAGQRLRLAFRRAGLDPDRDVVYLNLTRCMPPGNAWDTAEWRKAQRRCAAFLARDLARLPSSLPLLLVGQAPVTVFRGTGARIERERGLWAPAAGELAGTPPRPTFATWHPAYIVRRGDGEIGAAFDRDIARCVASLPGSDEPRRASVRIVPLAQAAALLRNLVADPPPALGFDIETYDAVQVPSRPGVAVDPFHPDFRVRGVALATGPWEAYWIEFLPFATPAEARAECPDACAALAALFASPVPKGGHNGQFDEEGLLCSGWVPEIRNRCFDSMLAAIALGDTSQGSLRLESLVVDVLGEQQYWDGADKSRMRELPCELVARGAGNDAAAALRLALRLHARLRAGAYLPTVPGGRR